MAVFSIPNKYIERNVNRSLERIERVGEYPRIALTIRSTLDHFTDKLMLQDTITMTNDPMKNAMVPSYFRYWHGYQIFLRPLLVIMYEPEMWCFYAVMFIFLLYQCIKRIKKCLGIDCVACFIISLLASYLWVAPFSLQYMNVYAIMVLASLLIFTVDENKWYILFFITGSFVNFMDLLTFPLLSCGLPLAIALVVEMHKEEYQLKLGLKTVIVNSIAWALGYGSTWIAKWVLAYKLLGPYVLSDVISQSLFRIAGNSQYKLSYYNVFQDNLFVLLLVTPEVWMVLILICIIIMQIRRKPWKIKVITLYNKIKSARNYSIPLGLIAIMPVCWYLFFANHSDIHEHFTFRIQAITIFACMMMLDISYSAKLPGRLYYDKCISYWKRLGETKKIVLGALVVLLIFV